MARSVPAESAATAGFRLHLPGLAPAKPSRSGAESPGIAALARLATLTGDWKGTAVWTGGRSGSYPMDATYSTTGGGSAVVETLTQDGVADDDDGLPRGRRRPADDALLRGAEPASPQSLEDRPRQR